MTTFNRQKLAAYVRARRGHKSLREIAPELEKVSFSTLSRVENKQNIDIDTFCALCQWLELPPQIFFEDINTVSVISETERIERVLLSSPSLPTGFVNAIMNLIRVCTKENK